MNHLATTRFWRCFKRVPKPIQELARKSLEVLKSDPKHPSLHFKRIGRYHSLRIGLKYRALAVNDPEGLVWVWIGKHSDYDKLIR